MANKYSMDNDPAVKSYQVEDDKAINQAGFSNLTEKEKELKKEIEKWSPKSQFACVILCLLHLHYFYVGRVGRGILTLCTVNFLFVGMIIDLLIICAGKFKDKQGRYVNNSNRRIAIMDLELLYREIEEGGQGMNQTREDALYQLSCHANSYLQGCATDTETARTYAEKLRAIKQAYYNVGHTRSAAGRPANVGGEIFTFIVVGLGLIAWLILYQIMGENFNARATYVIILCLAMHFATRNSMLSFVPFFIIFIGAFLGYAKLLILVYLGAAALYGAFHFIRKKKKAREVTETYEASKAAIGQLQKEMEGMLPAIRRELQLYEEMWYRENQALLLPADRRNFVGDHFPTAFWWQVTVEEMRQFERILSCDRYGDWETKLVYREPGTEFEGMDEYTPLFGQPAESPGKISAYYPKSQGYQVYDIISRLTVLSAEKTEVSYKVPAHSSLEKFYAHMSAVSFAADVDKAFEKNRITSSQRDSLAAEAVTLAWLAEEYSNETKTETGYEYIPVHNHSNIWTGQIALRPEEANGVVYYTISYYTCQLPHLFENLDALRGMNIAGIEYDCWASNPFFLAKFFSCFPNAV